MDPQNIPATNVGQLGEANLIRRLFRILGSWGNDLIGGPDDAVAFPAPSQPGMVSVFKTDMLVGKTDVPHQMSMYQAGKKTVVMNASDLFAKGVPPKWAVVSLGTLS